MNSHGLKTKIIVRKNGKEIYTENDKMINNSKIFIGDKELPFRSYTANWLKLLYLNWNGVTITIKDTAGVNRSFSNWVYGHNILNNSSTYGIFCGTGTTAVAQSDYDLETRIVNGSGAGQLNYDATGWSDTIIDSGTETYFDITRTITNNSGSPINITELGLVVNVNSSSYPVLISRDVFSPVTINNGETKTLKVRLSNSYSSTQGWKRNEILGMKTLINGSSETLYDTSGASRSVGVMGSMGEMNIEALAGVTTHGIRVGTGTTSFTTATPWNIDALITHGSSAGQLAYGSNNISNGLWQTPTINESSNIMRVGRNFNNVSGGSIIINEIDVVGFYTWAFELYRKVFASPIIVDDGENVDIIIEVSTSV